ncbi:nucleotidyltransferase domain-containing protein [Desulfosporosinus shakirovi]|uniref:nucleotidyltransferase domain-containing protein n=1 Tax=Desulfosporosinus shakirovi TaxID=2885154 RepID=UPI001E426D01|nr:nucleotidyltransferase domain-containing protein [Desulfosporosinus sp. SRJS8]MCB8815737.1 nucleotidyltransferase domain-containing protein [Desulfosporosinus sp. SRJS8]
MEEQNLLSIRYFCTQLLERLSTNLIDIRLFGSVASGTDTEESDIDLFLLVKDDDSITRDTILDVAFEANLEFDVLIVPIIMSKEAFSRPIFIETLLYEVLKNAESVIKDHD